jgi:hypothetical protein
MTVSDMVNLSGLPDEPNALSLCVSIADRMACAVLAATVLWSSATAMMKDRGIGSAIFGPIRNQPLFLSGLLAGPCSSIRRKIRRVQYWFPHYFG